MQISTSDTAHQNYRQSFALVAGVSIAHLNWSLSRRNLLKADFLIKPFQMAPGNAVAGLIDQRCQMLQQFRANALPLKIGMNLHSSQGAVSGFGAQLRDADHLLLMLSS